MGIVTTKEKIQGNLKDFVTVYMLFEYPPSNPCDFYRMLNQRTKHVINSRKNMELTNSFGE
jgi:hypothetical protein